MKMTQPVKLFLLSFCGGLLGSTVWLWSRVGTQVFLAYAEGAALWCF